MSDDLAIFKENWDLHVEIDRLRASNEELVGALEQIVQWSEAYPINVFHEPSAEECHRAHELLTANGMTLDAFSASMGRHCLKGVGDVARAAIAAAKGEE